MEYGLVVQWLFVVLAIGAISMPIATWLFRDEHAGPFAIAIGLAVLTLIAHLVGQFAYGWPAILAGFVVLGALSVLAQRRITVEWSLFGESAIVFFAAFCLLVAIRAVDPSAAPLPLAVGEKLLDFGILKSVERAATLPPEDMWFAGETVVYHYGGYVTTDLLSTLSGAPTRFAYNLGLATFYAVLVTTAYGLAGMIVSPYDVSRRLAAGLGAFFVGIAANLHTLGEILVLVLPERLVSWVATQVGIGGSLAAWTPAEFDGFWYFGTSRVLPVDPTAQNAYENLAATEFPLFAWLNGDLHAHMMSQPFMLLLAGLLLVYWRSPAESWRRPFVLLAAAGPIAGLLGLVNVFSFPTAGGLTAVVVFLAPGDPIQPLRRRYDTGLTAALGERNRWIIEEGRRVGFGLLAGAVVLLVGVLWTLPYWLEVATGGAPRTVAVWGKWSPLGGLLIVHGAFLVAFVAYLAGWLRPSFDAPARIGLLVLVAVVGSVVLGAPALGLFVPMGVLAWWIVRHRSGAGYEFALLAAGAGLVVLVELLTLEGSRFNVIFKYYAHVWLFFGVAAGVALARLASGLPDVGTGGVSRTWHTVGRVLIAVLLVTSGLYAAIALPVHFEGGSGVTASEGPTLDATAYVEAEYASEAPAIRWLDDRSGTPTIVSAAPSGYSWAPADGEGGAAPGSLTGLPTVLGRGAERLYRGPDRYSERLDAVETIYTGEPDRQRELLDRYDVSYVYVGPAERNAYENPITVDEVQGVTIAERFDSVTIYAYEG